MLARPRQQFLFDQKPLADLYAEQFVKSGRPPSHPRPPYVHAVVERHLYQAAFP
jgi:hypothetical protein